MSTFTIFYPEEIKSFGYTKSILAFKGSELAKRFFKNNITVYRLHQDNTETPIMFEDQFKDYVYGIMWSDYDITFCLRNYETLKDLMCDTLLEKEPETERKFSQYHVLTFDVFVKRANLVKHIDVTDLYDADSENVYESRIKNGVTFINKDNKSKLAQVPGKVNTVVYDGSNYDIIRGHIQACVTEDELDIGDVVAVDENYVTYVITERLVISNKKV